MQQIRLGAQRMLSCFSGPPDVQGHPGQAVQIMANPLLDLPSGPQEQVLTLAQPLWSASQTCKPLPASIDTTRTTLTLRWPHSPSRRDWAALRALLGRLSNLRVLDASCRQLRGGHRAATCPQGCLRWLALPSLTALNLHSTYLLTNLSALSSCTALVTLCLSDCNGLRDVAPLTACRSLTSLNLSLCMRLEDALPLAALPALAILSHNFSACSGISPAPDASLMDLNLAGCCIDNFTPLAAFLLLQRLDLSCSAIFDMTHVAACTALVHLRLEGCPHIADIAPLAACTVTLSLLANDLITNIRPLMALQRLDSLELGLENVTDLSPLRQCAVLKRLLLRSCPGLADSGIVLAAQVAAGLSVDTARGGCDWPAVYFIHGVTSW